VCKYGSLDIQSATAESALTLGEKRKIEEEEEEETTGPRYNVGVCYARRP